MTTGMLKNVMNRDYAKLILSFCVLSFFLVNIFLKFNHFCSCSFFKYELISLCLMLHMNFVCFNYFHKHCFVTLWDIVATEENGLCFSRGTVLLKSCCFLYSTIYISTVPSTNYQLFGIEFR